MKIVNLQKVEDGRVRGWYFDFEYKGNEGLVLAYVEASSNNIHGWHTNIAFDLSDKKAIESMISDYIKENGFSSPELEEAEQILKACANFSMRSVALEMNDRDLFYKYSDKKEEAQ